MAIACKYCIATKGLRGSDFKNLPQTEEEHVEHIERVHHMPVIMPGKTKEECYARFIKKYPEAATCPECIKAGAPWTKKGGN